MLTDVTATELLAGFLIGLLGLVFIRLSKCLPGYASKRQKRPERDTTIKTLLFFGSGGHTAEMLRMVKLVDSERYTPVDIVLSHSDVTSEGKIRAMNVPFLRSASWHWVFRSREVKQSWVTTVGTTLLSCVHSVVLIARLRPKLIVCNGPGTCVPICYAAFFLRLLGLGHCRIVFVESFCRVENLSLTGKLLYPIADKMLVQWPQLAEKYARADYVGVLC